MITEQLRAEAKPLAPTAPQRSRKLLKELTKSKKKGTQAGLQSPCNCWGHHYRLRKPNMGGEQNSLPKQSQIHKATALQILSCRMPYYYLLQSPSLASGKFQSHHQPTLPNAQWHLIIAHGSRLGSQASTHNSLHVWPFEPSAPKWFSLTLIWLRFKTDLLSAAWTLQRHRWAVPMANLSALIIKCSTSPAVFTQIARKGGERGVKNDELWTPK